MDIPSEFGYVMLVFVFIFFSHQWMSAMVMQARNKYKVPYPIQRGHQNSLEQLPWLLPHLFLAGVFYPVTAAAAGLVCACGRISYFIGYSSGVPDKRLYGLYYYLGLLTMIGCVIRAAVSLLQGTA